MTAPKVCYRYSNIVSRNIELVSPIACCVRRKVGNFVSLDDLIADGFVGLWEAYLRYKPDLCKPFRSFATPRIRGAMYDGLSSMLPFTRNTARRIRDIHVHRSFQDLINQELQLHRSHFMGRQSVSPIQATELFQTWEAIATMVRNLPIRMRIVVTGYYRDDLLMPQIATRLGLSVGQVSKIHTVAMKILRSVHPNTG